MNKVVLKPFDDNHFFVLLEDWLWFEFTVQLVLKIERRIYNKVLLKIYISMQGYDMT